MLIFIIIFSILGSVGAILAAAGFVFLRDDFQETLVPLLISFATGILLTAALLGLIPEAIEDSGGEAHVIMPYVLGGILGFFLMEKIIIWRNCRNKECEVHSHASGTIILLGDSLHNSTDGIVIAAAFLTSISLGIAASITIIIHEVAHETSDFGILLHSGFSRKKAILYNIVSSSTTIPAAIISYFILGQVEFAVPYLLAISAASFIYIALTDLAPDLHSHANLKHTFRQIIIILLGIFVMLLLLELGAHAH